MDLADSKSVQRFLDWAVDSYIPKAVVAQSTNGKLKTEWLDIPRNPHRKATFPHAHVDSVGHSGNREGKIDIYPNSQRLENSGGGFQSSGWVFPKNTVFNFRQLNDWASRLAPERMKGVFATDQGWFVFNCSDGLLTITQVDCSQDSRIELILFEAQWDSIEADLRSCIRP